MHTSYGPDSNAITDSQGRTIYLSDKELGELAAEMRGVEPVGDGAKARDRDGDIWTRNGGRWELNGLPSRPWHELVEDHGPMARVEPTDKRQS